MPSSAFALESPSPRTQSVRQRGRQRNGALAEGIVKGLLDACALARLGALTKRPTACVVVKGRKVFTGTAGCDFAGHLRDGRAVSAEVKFTRSRRFALRMIRTPQREELTRLDAAGGAAVVVLLAGPTPGLAVVYVVPWWLLAAAIERGDASVRVADLFPWRMRAGELLLQARGITEAVR
jgi:hypothetical protein